MSALKGDLTEWFADQYLQASGVQLLEGGANFTQMTQYFPVPCDMGVKASGRLRMERFLELKMRFPLSVHGYCCRALTARYSPETAPTTYAFLFWPAGGALEYICVAPTFNSRDGEFRRRFVPIKAFQRGCEELADLLAPAEDAIASKLSTGTLEMRSTDFTAGAAPAVDERLPLLALAAAVTLDAWDSGRSLLAVHIQPNYLAFVALMVSGDPAIVVSSRKLGVHPARFLLLVGTRSNNSSACGVKLVPMFAREVQHPFDFNLGAWRELEISRAVSDLVVQFVSPSFALYNQWSYVEHAGAPMFENSAMHERYARSRRLARALAALRAGRGALDALGADLSADLGAASALDPGAPDPSAPDSSGLASSTPDSSAPDSSRLDSKDFVMKNYHTEELSSQLYESLEYAQSHLVTSDVALMHTMEDVGRTLHSWPAYVRRAADPVPAATRLFATAGGAARVLFDYAYGAHCLHSLIGVAHCDLHSNNLTVFEWGRIDAVDKSASPTEIGVRQWRPLYDDPRVLYALGPGENDCYLFPADGISGALIDYSRAIVGPGFRSRIEAGRSAQYATNFYRDQVNRAMRALHRYAPEYVAANQDALKGAAYADFESVFAVLCATDFIAIGAALAALAAEAAIAASATSERAADPLGVRKFVVAPELGPLARALEMAGREALIAGLHGIVGSARRRRTGGCPECAEMRGGAETCGGPAAPCRECLSVSQLAIDEDARGRPAETRGGAAIEFPGAAIIKKVFAQFCAARANLYKHSNHVTKESHSTHATKESHSTHVPQLVDVYSYNNYCAGVSTTEYTAWPKWARISEIEKHLGELKMTDLFERGTEGFLETLVGQDVPLEALAAQERADAERRDGKPTAAASSWLDE